MGWIGSKRREARPMAEVHGELAQLDRQLASRHGAYLSYHTEAGPAAVECYGQPPAEHVDRLLDLYARTDSHVLDVGCGAGQTLCRLAARVQEAWGIDLLETVLRAARLRATAAGLANVTLVHGNVAERETAGPLPDGHFDLGLSRRGPNFNAALVAKLKPRAFVVQELVGGGDGEHLRVLLGRQAFLPHDTIDHGGTVRSYLDLGLFPVSSTEFFYDEVFRDVDPRVAYLQQTPATLSDWRLGPRPYGAAPDRAALELYARYHHTSDGIRLLRHRWVFAFRRAPTRYYPADYPVEGAPGQGEPEG